VNTVVVASSEQDAAAVEAVKQHHAELAGALATLVEGVVAASEQGGADAARERLAQWAETQLVPHALAEEQALYPLAHQDDRARLLVDAMLAEHRLIVDLVTRLRTADSPVRVAADGFALQVLFESHLAKENDQILPLLAGLPGVSLAGALDGMHALLGGHEHDPERGHGQGHAEAGAAGGCGGGCSCGETDPVGVAPELDARAVPHAIRHATIFGALESVQPGQGLVLLAPHDPLPLLRQLESRAPGAFSVDYLERGPETWRLHFVRS
jgi:uncharacterized protein (DUF2249 family)